MASRVILIILGGGGREGGGRERGRGEGEREGGRGREEGEGRGREGGEGRGKRTTCLSDTVERNVILVSLVNQHPSEEHLHYSSSKNYTLLDLKKEVIYSEVLHFDEWFMLVMHVCSVCVCVRTHTCVCITLCYDGTQC